MRSVVLLFGLFSFSFGCGGCGDPCEGVECPDGLTCIEGDFEKGNAACVSPDRACQPDCQTNERCNSEKKCEVVPIQCKAEAEACDPRFAVNEGYLCVDADGPGPAKPACLSFCEKDGSCKSGALCFLVNSNSDSVCTKTEDCSGSKTCDQGFCRDRVCRQSECEGLLSGKETCETLYENNSAFPDGAQCVELQNDSNFCFPAGPKKTGEACETIQEAFPKNSFANTCQSGSLCVTNTCRLACEKDKDCEPSEGCVIAADADVGFCGKKCTPFEKGKCGSGFSCLPLGKNEGLCIESGTNQLYSECTPGQNQCKDGSLCIPYEDNLGRCQPLCDLSVGEPNPDGSVGEFPQAKRDATCPQSKSVGSFVRFHNVAELATGVDIYFGDQQTPTFSNLKFKDISDSDTNKDGEQYTEIDPKQYTIKILPTGAPRSDPSLVEKSESLTGGSLTDFYILPVDQTPDKAELISYKTMRGELPATTSKTKLRVQHNMIDITNIDLILVPVDDDLSDPLNQIKVVENLSLKMRSDFIEVPIGNYDLLVFKTGDSRNMRSTALASLSAVSLLNQTLHIVVRGSANPDDLPLAGIEMTTPLNVLPSAQGAGPRFTCVALNNNVFGFCQQQCFDDSGFKKGACMGEKMACSPSFLQSNNSWKNLCGPEGKIAIDKACDPAKNWGECAEGLHCLSYGNTVKNFDAQKRGRCQSLCVSNRPTHPTLSCGQGQECQPFVYNDEYKLGKCNYSCTSNNRYEDLTCPTGLRSCKPIASQAPDLSGGLPAIQEEQAFCSASGDIMLKATCGGADCLPGSECMYPRSAGKTSFLTSIASSYFGAQGLQASCTAQCDPFDHDSSSVKCGSDETCLFNFPWSAEVGHCAKIIDKKPPLSECTNPGEACGKDSICVVNGNANMCFQFCQYEGPLNGALQSSGCANGLVCNPFVNDVGICLEAR